MDNKLQKNLTNQTINVVTIIGNVGQNAIVKTLSSGGNIVSFSVATSENKKNEKFTEWHSVNVFSNNVTTLTDSIKRGAKIYVEGYMRYFSYVDSSGNKNYSFYIDAIQIGVGLLKKKPMDTNIGNGIKLKGIAHNFAAEIKESKEETEGVDRSYALVRFKVKTVKNFISETGESKSFSDDHNIRGIINPAALEDVREALADNSEIVVLGKVRYTSHVDEMTDAKIIRKNVIVDLYDLFKPLSIESDSRNKTNDKPAPECFEDLPF